MSSRLRLIGSGVMSSGFTGSEEHTGCMFTCSLSNPLKEEQMAEGHGDMHESEGRRVSKLLDQQILSLQEMCLEKSVSHKFIFAGHSMKRVGLLLSMPGTASSRILDRNMSSSRKPANS